MTLSNFEDLEIWKLSRALSKDIYQITDSQEFKSDIRFCSQIRAAVGSIMDNIAEGFEREGKKNLFNFCMLLKAHVVKCAASYTELWMLGLFQLINATLC